MEADGEESVCVVAPSLRDGAECVCVCLQAEALTARSELFYGLYLLNHGERLCLIFKWSVA